MACIQWCPKKAIDYKGLTYARKHYHNPYILVKDMKDFQQTEIVEWLFVEDRKKNAELIENTVYNKENLNTDICSFYVDT